jgi:Protein of unknown function (DUF3891)
MLLRPDGDAVIAITQPAHAWVSGQLARAWGNERFGAVRPWEEVCLAAEQHDVGMTDWELAPTLNRETGLPHSFMEMDLGTHLGLWSSAAHRVAPQSRYAALLVSLHGTALYERRDLARLAPEQAGRVRAFLAEQRELQDRLRPPGATDEEVARNQRLVWTWDSLSLGLLLGWTPYELRAVPTAGEPVDVAVTEEALDPWPFATEEVTVRAEARRLAGRYDDEAAMRSALARAPVITLERVLRRAGP